MLQKRKHPFLYSKIINETKDCVDIEVSFRRRNPEQIIKLSENLQRIGKIIGFETKEAEKQKNEPHNETKRDENET